MDMQLHANEAKASKDDVHRYIRTGRPFACGWSFRLVIDCAFYSNKNSMVMLCSAYSHQRTMLLYSTFPHSKRWKRKWQQNYYWMTFIQGIIFEEEVNIAEVQSLLPWVLFVLLFYSSPHKSRRINVYHRVTGDPRKLWIYIIITHAVWSHNKAQHLNVRWMCKRVWLSELVLLLNV